MNSVNIDKHPVPDEAAVLSLIPLERGGVRDCRIIHWQDDCLCLWFMYRTIVRPVGGRSHFSATSLTVFNRFKAITLDQLRVNFNISRSGDGAQFWEDEIRNHDPNAQDSKTVSCGNLPPGAFYHLRMEWRVWHMSGPRTVSFEEKVGITPCYTIDYTNYPWTNASIAVKPS